MAVARESEFQICAAGSIVRQGTIDFAGHTDGSAISPAITIVRTRTQ